ncbi:MAG: GAF domain-containing protein [Bdellovibrionota bacterium]
MKTVSDYQLLLKELSALLEGERDLIANAANVGAFVMENITQLNWVGFYFYKNNELVVGPFQGKVACTRIAIGRGVCGRAFKDNKVYNVPDVHAVSDHIACDTASESELVVPLYLNSVGIGVFDIDSPIKNRFDKDLQDFLEGVANVFISATHFG